MPNWTISEAARECGVHPDTIRRRLPVLRQHGAEKDRGGAWRLTPDTLRAAGFHPGKPRSSDDVLPTASTTSNPQQPQGDALRQQVAELQQALAVEQVRREAAEALAAERATALDRADLALRALNARTPPTATELVEQTHPQPTLTQERQQSRGWWRRRA